MAKKNKLPNKPSALILMAVDDLAKAERTKGYRVDMGSWHEPNEDYNTNKPVCEVCFAGSVIAMSLKTKPDQEKGPGSFDSDTCQKLEALNEFRTGEIREGLTTMGIDPDEHFVPNTYPVVEYSDNKTKFKKDMRRVAGYLAAVGL